MTASYDRSGICFLYPENWRITDEEVQDMPYSVSVQSPDSGFWSLMVYAPNTEPETLIEQTLASMREEYEGLETLEVSERLAGVDSSGCDMCFYCLDFLVNARVLATRALGKTLLILWQAEDREFDQLEPVFRAITISLLQSRKVRGTNSGVS